MKRVIGILLAALLFLSGTVIAEEEQKGIYDNNGSLIVSDGGGLFTYVEKKDGNILEVTSFIMPEVHDLVGAQWGIVFDSSKISMLKKDGSVFEPEARVKDSGDLDVVNLENRWFEEDGLLLATVTEVSTDPEKDSYINTMLFNSDFTKTLSFTEKEAFISMKFQMKEGVSTELEDIKEYLEVATPTAYCSALLPSGYIIMPGNEEHAEAFPITYTDATTKKSVTSLPKPLPKPKVITECVVGVPKTLRSYPYATASHRIRSLLLQNGSVYTGADYKEYIVTYELKDAAEGVEIDTASGIPILRIKPNSEGTFQLVGVVSKDGEQVYRFETGNFTVKK